MNIASSWTRLSTEKWMLARVTLLAAGVFVYLTPGAASQASADWTILSRDKKDERIMRQMETLAAKNGAQLHWLQSLPPKTRSEQHPGGLRIELNAASNANAFVSLLTHEARGSKVKQIGRAHV